MEHENLRIIGTSHIARQSLREVEQAISDEKPDIVAVELDRKRLHAMFSKQRDKIRIYDIRRIGVKGFFFSLIGAWAEKKLGKLVGVSPGSEMKKAVRLAKKNGMKLALIDQDIETTLNRFSKTLTWKEKWNFAADIFKSIFFRKKMINFDLTKVPGKKLIKKLIGYVKKRYPNVYKVLIEERNSVMAENLKKLMQQHPDKKILAIVGAGHEEDIKKLIEKGENNISYSVNVG